MANFLERLVARSKGSSPIVRPQVAPVFGPQLRAPQPDGRMGDVYEGETTARMSLYANRPVAQADFVPTESTSSEMTVTPRDSSILRKQEPRDARQPLVRPIVAEEYGSRSEREPEPQTHPYDAPRRVPSKDESGLRNRNELAGEPGTVPMSTSPHPDRTAAPEIHGTTAAKPTKSAGADGASDIRKSVRPAVSESNGRTNAPRVQPPFPYRAQPVAHKTTETEPTVEVTIGRLEVHMHASEPRRESKPRTSAPTPSLNEYLQRRSRRQP